MRTVLYTIDRNYTFFVIQHFSIDVGKLSILWELKERSIQLFKLLQKNPPTRGRSEEVNPRDKLSFYMQQVEDIVFTQCVPKVVELDLLFNLMYQKQS